MYHRENINNVKREKRMADFLGHSDKLITLSLSLSQALAYNIRETVSPLIYFTTRGSPASIYGFPCFLQWEASLFFVYI